MENLSNICFFPYIGCLSLLLVYVLSLYVWQNTHLRNDQSVIKKRFVSVLVTSVLSPFAIYLFSENDFVSKNNIFDLLGMRYPGIFMAATVPLILTMVLFLGPLTMQSQTEIWHLYSEMAQANVPSSVKVQENLKSVSEIDNKTMPNGASISVSSGFKQSDSSVMDSSLGINKNIISKTQPTLSSESHDISPGDHASSQISKDDKDFVEKSEPMYWIDSCKDLAWLRDHIVAPFSEELTFRACMLPLLIQCLRPQKAVFICPLFFGMAHFHHVYGRVKNGCKLKTAFLLSGFQFLYTTLFGAYSAFLFLRTGHFIAPFLAHSFCNHIGFPNFREILFYNEPKRTITFLFCVIGLVSWCCLLEPLTNPSWYRNTVYWRI